jgi:hypothetical protein
MLSMERKDKVVILATSNQDLVVCPNMTVTHPSFDTQFVEHPLFSIILSNLLKKG